MIGLYNKAVKYDRSGGDRDLTTKYHISLKKLRKITLEYKDSWSNYLIEEPANLPIYTLAALCRPIKVRQIPLQYILEMSLKTCNSRA